MKIIVETEELKQEILKQSEYIHDFLINKDDVKNLGKDWLIGLDSDKAGVDNIASQKLSLSCGWQKSDKLTSNGFNTFYKVLNN